MTRGGISIMIFWRHTKTIYSFCFGLSNYGTLSLNSMLHFDLVFWCHVMFKHFQAQVFDPIRDSCQLTLFVLMDVWSSIKETPSTFLFVCSWIIKLCESEFVTASCYVWTLVLFFKIHLNDCSSGKTVFSRSFAWQDLINCQKIVCLK